MLFFFLEGAIVISSIRYPAFANLSIINNTYLISTEIVRCTVFSKAISPLIASQLPSKAVPTSSPCALITGEPELPPVMSLFEIKLTLRLPLSSTYLP